MTAIIPKMTKEATFRREVGWLSLHEVLANYAVTYGLDLRPAFSNGRRWSRRMQTEYVEYKLKGGRGKNEISLNCPGGLELPTGRLILVDGKQRLNAVLAFLEGTIRPFGYTYKGFGDTPILQEFVFLINDLPTMQEVYRWCVELHPRTPTRLRSEINEIKRLADDKSQSSMNTLNYQNLGLRARTIKFNKLVAHHGVGKRRAKSFKRHEHADTAYEELYAQIAYEELYAQIARIVKTQKDPS